jgi:hypothetical protein
MTHRWRQVELDVPTRKSRFAVYDTKVQIAGGEFRQLVIKDLGHEQRTVLLTNDRKTAAAKVITRYASHAGEVDPAPGGTCGKPRGIAETTGCPWPRPASWSLDASAGTHAGYSRV